MSKQNLSTSHGMIRNQMVVQSFFEMSCINVECTIVNDHNFVNNIYWENSVERKLGQKAYLLTLINRSQKDIILF